MDSPPPPAGEMDFAPPPEISHPPPPRPLGPSSGKSTQRRADTWGDPDPSITSQRCRGWRPSCRCQNFDPTALCSDERCEKKRSPSTDHGPLHLGSHLMGMGNGPQQDWRMGTCQAVLLRFCPSTRCGAQLPFLIGQPRTNISALWDMRWGWGALHSTRAAPYQPPQQEGDPKYWIYTDKQ